MVADPARGLNGGLKYLLFNRKSSEKTWLTRIAIAAKNIMRMNWFRLGRGQLEENIQTVSTDPLEKVLERMVRDDRGGLCRVGAVPGF